MLRHNQKKPERMISQNSGLRRYGIHNFSSPALAGKSPDGREYVTWPASAHTLPEKDVTS